MGDPILEQSSVGQSGQVVVERLRDEPRVALDIVRAGRSRTLVYDLR